MTGTLRNKVNFNMANILERLRSTQSQELNVQLRNCNDLVSLMQTADGAMEEVKMILQRMFDLAQHSSDSSNSRSDRVAIQEEIAALSSEIDCVAETASFGGKKVLDGTFGSQQFPIGRSSHHDDTVVLTLGNMRSDSSEMSGKIYIAEGAESRNWGVTTATNLTLNYPAIKLGEAKSITFTIHARQGDRQKDIAPYINSQSDDVKAFVGEDGKLRLFASNQAVNGAKITVGGDLGSEMGFGVAKDTCVADVDVTAIGGGQQAIAVLCSALKTVDGQRAALRELLDRVNHVINNLTDIIEDSAGAPADSRIVDSDLAKETTAMTKSQILAQAAATALANANRTPSSALGLLQ